MSSIVAGPESEIFFIYDLSFLSLRTGEQEQETTLREKVLSSVSAL
jgi:hypothetical protein